eukprot:m.60007 g.60007  ORF g.60007 m.60007 type:complete len:128 (-) comp7930_c0_seq2:1609-1992(-)
MAISARLHVLATAACVTMATVCHADASKPNILLFFPDEFRYDWGPLGYYNNTDLPLITPNFDQLATEGVRFTRAFVGAPVCAPSRACLASGRQYDDNTVPENFHNDSIPRWLHSTRCCGTREGTIRW